ncbi:adenylyltransferase/cytidyltransferase family protein [Patescibacteria group bacterium]
MKSVYVYPGSFCPPTKGHVHVMEKVSQLFPEIIVLCSVNPNKYGQWFTQEECKSLWHSYQLPSNVRVETFADFSQQGIDFSRIIMIRGIRHELDMQEEKGVMLLNIREFGLDKFFFQICEPEFREISSTKARRAALDRDYKKLQKMVSPEVFNSLLVKAEEGKV